MHYSVHFNYPVRQRAVKGVSEPTLTYFSAGPLHLGTLKAPLISLFSTVDGNGLTRDSLEQAFTTDNITSKQSAAPLMRTRSR